VHERLDLAGDLGEAAPWCEHGQGFSCLAEGGNRVDHDAENNLGSVTDKGAASPRPDGVAHEGA